MSCSKLAQFHHRSGILQRPRPRWQVGHRDVQSGTSVPTLPCFIPVTDLYSPSFIRSAYVGKWERGWPIQTGRVGRRLNSLRPKPPKLRVVEALWSFESEPTDLRMATKMSVEMETAKKKIKERKENKKKRSGGAEG